MLMTGRQVARSLGLGRETANRVLASGLVGAPIRTGSAHLYYARRVDALRTRPVVDDSTPLPPACSHGVLVARIDPRQGAAEGPWPLAPGRFAVLAVLVGEHGSLPLVTTVGGFVTGGADVTGYRAAHDNPRHVLLRTSSPGDWYATFDGHSLRTPPGNPLLFWRCRLSPPSRARHEDPWPPPWRARRTPPPAAAG
jgi:hypothetical protein